MQAVILAAGRSSRFYPFSHFPHKSCAPLLGKPIFIHTLESLKKAGITDVVVVTGKNNAFQDLHTKEKDLGLSIRFVEQHEPLGMGDALLQAKEYIAGEFLLLHPHHVEVADCFSLLREKRQSEDEIVLLAQEEEVVEKYGVLKIENDKVVEIVEKPKKGEEPSKLRVIGMYLLNRKFLDILQDTPSGHYNFEQAITNFAKLYTAQYVVSNQKISSLKYPWDLLQVNAYLLEHMEKKIADTAHIASNVTINGNVVIEEGAKIHEGATIKGPCYIGKNVVVGNNAVVRDFVTVSDNCVIGANMEVKNSVFFDYATTHSGFIGASVIGAGTKIAAFFCTANVRLDRKTVKVQTENGEVDSGMRQLGTILGNDVRIGIRVATMPGVIVGNSVVVGPSTNVLKNIPDSTTYYTKFHEIVEKNDTGSVPEEKLTEEKNMLVLFDIDYTLFNTGTFKESNLMDYEVYEEVVESLLSLGKIARLGIFSEGEMDFQRTKLLKTDIYTHFLDENIHIVQSKDESLREVLKSYKNENIYLVDDKLTVLYAAKKVAPNVRVIWVRRGMYAENQKPIEDFLPDAQVYDLRDIVTVIKELSNL